MSTESVLAVDYGTSNTVAMLARPGRGPEPVLFDGSPAIPSTVFATADGRLVCGRDAERWAASDPARCEPNPKQRINDGTVRLGDGEFAVAELIAVTLRRVAEEAQRVNGGRPQRVVLTHPADWGNHRIAVLCDAAGRAGFVAPQLIAEPVAAAYHFASDGLADGRAALVYDLGAGTCDMSVVSRQGGDVRVRGTTGLTDFGGLDIDHAIVEHLRAAHRGVPEWSRLLAPQTPADRRHRRTLWEDVRGVKELLTRESYVSLWIPLLEVDTHLTRSQLEELTLPLLRGSVDEARRLVKTAGVSIGAVYLTGGGSRMPLVATELLRALRIPAEVPDQPELVIAGGALRSADSVSEPLTPPSDRAPAYPDPAAPPRDGFVPPSASPNPAAPSPRASDEQDITALREEVLRLQQPGSREPVRALTYTELRELRDRLRAGSAVEPITPEEVRDVVFNAVRFEPGYQESEVDEFLDKVEARVRLGETPLPPGAVVEFTPTRFRLGYRVDEVDRFIDRLRALS